MNKRYMFIAQKYKIIYTIIVQKISFDNLPHCQTMLD